MPPFPRRSSDCNQESNSTAMQPSEELRNSNHAELLVAAIKNACVRVGSAHSQSRGAPEISEQEAKSGYYRPLLRAAFKGDWEYAKRFFEQDYASRTAKITSRSETALHIAAFSAQDHFVEKLVELLSPYPKALEEVDCDGRTALHIAVLCGRIKMVKALVRSTPRLTQLADNERRVPLELSAREASMHKEIAWLLAKSTTDDGPTHPFTGPSGIDIIIYLSYAGHYGISVNLDESISAGSKDPGSLWNAVKMIVPTIKRIHEVKLTHVAAVELAKQACRAISFMTTTAIIAFFEEQGLLRRAISRGIPELVELWIGLFPELVWLTTGGVSLRTFAVTCRQESILRLFLKESSTNMLSFVPAPTPQESMQIMLAAARCNPNLGGVNKVSGAAFGMQRELQWFRAMEMCIIPDVRTADYDGKTFWMIFMEKHERLLHNGEMWVKETANQCMVVSTLIATVLFAAAFTVPGGNDNNTGIPLLLGKDSLLIFAISDTLGLFSSVMAIMLFLAILTSQYEWEDFLRSLPKKIIMGLSFLFLSLAFMLVAFAATLTIVLDKRLEWVFIPITLLSSLTVFIFLGLQLPLLFRMVKSTYGPSILHPWAFENEA